MKTKKEPIVSTMAVSLEDVIFSNRNQAYGAYKLRKSYNKHLLIALIFTTFILIAGVGIPYLKYLFFPNKTVTETPPLIKTVTIEPEQQVVVPPPPPREPSNEALKVARNNTFILVDTLEKDSVKFDFFPPEITSSVNTDDSSKIIFGDVAKIGNDSKEEPPYIDVQEPATFKGGDVNKFRDWVEHNIVYPEDALSADIQGKVTVTFVVNTNGEVCNVNILRGVHPSINDETTKVLLNSPKWMPATQDGSVVKQQFSAPIDSRIR